MNPTSSRRIELKSEKDLEHMRRAGALTGQVLRELSRSIIPGVSTMELDRMA
ncbi:MAG: type I methionyl aminopeptidase, partial [Elusimicrobia bacterium]|nr:type I methionyl aminopeptidase [Elusimicrobiota bacterium]